MLSCFLQVGSPKPSKMKEISENYFLETKV